MDTKHTPAPWNFEKLLDNWHGDKDWTTFTVRDSRNCCLAVVGEVDRLPALDNEANARVMHAAPDLLAALEYLTGAMATFTPRCTAWDAYKVARAAIAKATGK